MDNNNCCVCHNGPIKKYFTFKSNNLIALRCRRCGHVFIKNSPINHSSISNYYTMEDFKGKRKTQPGNWYTKYYNDCFEDYGLYLNSSLTLKQFKKKIKYLNFKFPQKGRILDVGCATGVFLDIMRKEEWLVEGTEISNDLAAYAKEKFHIPVHMIDLTRERLNREPFHVITLFDVIEHIPDPNLIINGCKELLREDGLFVIRTPNENGLLRDIAKIIYRSSLNKFELPMLWFYSFEHLHSFSPRNLNSIIRKHGFSIVKIFREEESVDRLNTPSIVKSLIKGIGVLSFLLNKQHKIIVVARKNM